MENIYIFMYGQHKGAVNIMFFWLKGILQL